MSTIQYTLYILIGMAGIGLVYAIGQSIIRSLGLELIITLRPRTDPGRYPVDWDRKRRVVLLRDGYACRNCGSRGRQLHVHHIVPLSSGGSNEWSNLVTLCRVCHRRLHPDMKDYR